MSAKSITPERRPREDLLAAAIERFEHAAAAPAPGRERDWAAGLDAALASLQDTFPRHLETAEGPDGLFTEIDLTRPSLTRKVGQLRTEHRSLPETVGSLREQVRQLGRAFEPAVSPGDLAKPLPPPEATLSRADPESVRRSADQLLSALKLHRDLEVDLVLESVDTDLGTGD